MFSTIIIMPPTISANVSVASGASGLSDDAYSIDAASFNESTKGTSTKGTSTKESIVKHVEYVFLSDADCCLAEYGAKGADLKLNCGNTKDCGHHGHKEKAAKPGGRGLEGSYKPKANGRFLDGIAGTRILAEGYEQSFKAARDDNRAATALLTAEGGTTADSVVDEEADLKLPSFDVTPARTTMSCKVEKLMSEARGIGWR